MSDAGRFKVVMLGESGVGKTSIVERLTQPGQFSSTHVPTVGTQFSCFEVIAHEKPVQLDIWDTAGQEIYRSLCAFYARDSHGALIVFDVASEFSFRALPTWVDFIKNESPLVKIVLFGNKEDLPRDEWQVTEAAIRGFASQHELKYVLGSAKTGHNITDVFETLGEVLTESATVTSNATLAFKRDGGREKGGCC